MPMSVQDFPGATDGLERLERLVTNSAIQSIFKGTLNDVTTSAYRVVRLAEGVKQNKGDIDALALDIAAFDGCADEIAGQLKKLTFLIVFKYKDDRLELVSSNTVTESIVSLMSSGL
ncbi:hypothetical protein FRB96_005726 [Tulasnella sp. 330]|nr:hypothetical protein FRB96_005726 [Tulasnella sp. 330]